MSVLDAPSLIDVVVIATPLASRQTLRRHTPLRQVLESFQDLGRRVELALHGTGCMLVGGGDRQPKIVPSSYEELNGVDAVRVERDVTDDEF